MMTDTIAVGIDAGGTKTRTHAVLGIDTVAVAEGSGANLKRAGLEAAAETLASTVRSAVGDSDRPLSICAGVAGAGRPHDQVDLAAALRRNLVEYQIAEVRVVHDGVIALEAAFEGEAGIIAIAGTGSLVLGKNVDDEFFRAGGWGYLIGDEGSGHALGAATFRAVADAFDGGPSTSLVDLARDRYDINNGDELIDRIYRDGTPLQQAARIALEAAENGDVVAIGLIERQTAGLAHQIHLVAGRMKAEVVPVSFLGGLGANRLYRQALSDAVRNGLPGADFRSPAGEPVHGAVRLAKQAAPVH
jgi:glucosamine kinase